MRGVRFQQILATKARRMAHGQQEGGEKEPDQDPQETADWLEALDGVLATEGVERAHYLIEALIDKARRQARICRTRPPPPTSTRSTSTTRRAIQATRRSSTGIRSYVRWNALAMVVQGEQAATRARRAHLDLRVGRDALRCRLQPLLQRPGPSRRRRPDLHPGALRARHLRARVPRGPAQRGAARPLPPRDGRRRRAVLVSASAADAGVLAVPDRVDGPRSDDGHLPGALHALPAEPRPDRRRTTRACGRTSATARWTSPSRSARSRSLRARSSTT